LEHPLNRLLYFLENKRRNIVGLRLLRIGFSIALVGKIIAEIFFWEFLLTPAGPNYIVGQGNFYEFFFTDFGRITYFSLSLISATLLVVDKFFYVGVVLFCSSYMTSGIIMQTGHGGLAFARLMSVYFLLTIPDMMGNKGGYSRIKIFFHNVGVGALYFQGMIVYFSSGIAKVPGTVWQEGTALYYILSTERFGVSYVAPIVGNTYLSPIMTYSVLIFQLGFPFMVFSRFPLALIWALAGIIIHLCIAIFMGLWLFSAVIIAYTLFTIPDREWDCLKEKSQVVFSRVARMWQPTIINSDVKQSVNDQ
jgi:hypothetical protein